ncbi:MAG: hypothetical protein GX434_04700 [Peptococcaceae bacterium]|nr:hypothetical protein [Peptococcaceae bacterium]
MIRGSKFFLTVFSLWLAVSLYFYLEHRITVKTMVIPGWDQDSNVLLKKVEIIEKERKPSMWMDSPARNIAGSFEAQLSGADPLLLSLIYKLNPAAEFKDQSFFVKDKTSIELLGYEKAKQVTFNK